MPSERYYIESTLQINDQVTLEGEEAHHLSKVMRGRVGDLIELVNGRGILAEGAIHNLGKNKVEIGISKILKTANKPTPVIIAQGFPRLNRIDIIVEKGTELGMTQLWLFEADQSEKKELSSNQETRFKNIAISAMKQCGCLYLPEILEKPPIKKWEALPYRSYFGDTSENAPSFTSLLTKEVISKGIIFVVGPEKGFSDAEYKHLKKLNAEGVSLHYNILRTDTAPLCALSQLAPHTGLQEA